MRSTWNPATFPRMALASPYVNRWREIAASLGHVLFPDHLHDRMVCPCGLRVGYVAAWGCTFRVMYRALLEKGRCTR